MDNSYILEFLPDNNIEKWSINIGKIKRGYIDFKPDYFDIFFDPEIDFSKEFTTENIKYQLEKNLYPSGNISNIELKHHVQGVTEKFISNSYKNC